MHKNYVMQGATMRPRRNFIHRQCRKFLFYFYLFGTIFLLLDSYAGATRLPPMSSTYNICHYHQVHLPEEVMALEARYGRMRSLSEKVLRHQRKNMIQFIVGKKLGNNVTKNKCR